jgi:hypothetical protein
MSFGASLARHIRMRVFAFISILTGVLLLLTPGDTAAQSRCADCHFANMRPAFASHISDWDTSAHSRSRVGCDGCHGGNATTFESLMAHRDVLPPSNPASPVHRSNIVTTCGSVYAGPFVAFQKSRHYQLLTAGNSNVPTCITCHEETGSRLLSPNALEGQCASCHGPGKRPPARVPARGRTMLEGIRDARTRCARRTGHDRAGQDRRARLSRWRSRWMHFIEAGGHALFTTLRNAWRLRECARGPHRVGGPIRAVTSMKLSVVALDYDGTIANGNPLDSSVRTRLPSCDRAVWSCCS